MVRGKGVKMRGDVLRLGERERERETERERKRERSERENVPACSR